MRPTLEDDVTTEAELQKLLDMLMLFFCDAVPSSVGNGWPSANKRHAIGRKLLTRHKS